MTHAEATSLVMELRAHYAQKVPDETIMVYAGHLEPYEYTIAATGLRRLVEEEVDRFFPSWALVQRYVGEATVGHAPPADEAWLELQREIRRTGAYSQPTLHPLTAAAVDTTGGWIAACHATEGDPWTRKAFIDVYHDLAARAARTGRIPQANLTGIFGRAPATGGLSRITPLELEAE